MSGQIPTWDRFSAAPQPLRLEVQLARVWHVRVGPEYNVLPGQEPLSGRVIRTLQGQGSLILKGNHRLDLPRDSVVYVPYRQIQRYWCSGEIWHFWWFECEWSGGGAEVLGPRQAEQLPDEATLCRQLWSCLPQAEAARGAEAVGIFAHLVGRWFSGRTTPGEATSGGRTSERIAAVLAEIPNRVGPEPWNVQAMAQYAGMSERAFRTHFNRITGQSPKAYYDQQRLTLASRYLRTTQVTLETLADQLGYSSPFHLSKAFKALFGETPKQHRAGRL